MQTLFIKKSDQSTKLLRHLYEEKATGVQRLIIMDCVREANRYLDNAKQIIADRLKIDCKEEYFLDAVYIKYVKLAGHTAYTGILIALDTLFRANLPTEQEVHWDWYKLNITTLDKHQSERFYSLYSIFCLSMECDGFYDMQVANIGFEEASKLLNWVELQLNILDRQGRNV